MTSRKRKPPKRRIHPHKIAIDFDGTCVSHEFPHMGEDIGAAPVLKALTDAGHLLILFTMRHGKGLQAAVEWFSSNDIPLWGINTDPIQSTWTDSPKAYADLYIDDRGLGIPLVLKPNTRPHVDWTAVTHLLKPLLPTT